MKTSKRRYVWLPLWIALGVAIGIFIGNTFSIFNSRKSLFYRGDKLEAILEYINESYVDTVDIQGLVEEAIPGLIAGLDPHSNYFSVKDMEITGDELADHFSGIGVQFRLQKDSIVVVGLVAGGPSEAAGILPGDRIIYVNDSLFAGNKVTNEKVMSNLKGPKGSSVKLGIKRPTEQKIIDIKVKRDDVPVNSVDVSFSPVDRVGYIKVSKFAGNTFNEFIAAISKLKSQGADSFIVDLRQNSGGYLNAAIDMINEFLNGGDLIVYTEGRAFPRASSYATGSGTCKDNQIVVLIDESSASASEVFAGAIQDSDRGLVIGRRSYGKGLVQSQVPFKDGSALRLTIARYYTPSGRCIQKSYEMGKGGDYSQDLMNRFLRGEFDSADSIKMVGLPLFETASGRPVYGNDGVMPDIFIPRDTTGINSYYSKVMGQGMLFDYVFMYSDMHREKLKKFKTSQEMAAYLSKQPLLQNLVSYAENQGLRQRPYLIAESRTLLQTQLEAYIVRDFFGEDGFYPILLRNDVVLKKAIEMIKAKKATPESIKKLAYKDKK